MIGFGVKDFEVAIYIANRPPIDHYPTQRELIALKPGEINYICKNTSNHWRKAFNVYAKFLLELRGESLGVSTWQEYRDEKLLQNKCKEALFFSPPDLSQSNKIHIIAGKTYALELEKQLGFDSGEFRWIDKYFAVCTQHKIIVSPYLDYRQLSNERIERLVGLVKELASS